MNPEGKKDWAIPEMAHEQCQLCVDTENRCLVLEFSEPTEMFAFDVETARSFRDALEKGLKMLAQLDS